MDYFFLEGELIKRQSVDIWSLPSLIEALKKETILEAASDICDEEHNLLLNLGEFKGIIERTECAVGIKEGKVRDIAILSKVGKPICFVVTSIDEHKKTVFLSRAKAQNKFLESFFNQKKPGDVIRGCVTRNEPFGTFVDIGCGVPSFISIENISVSRISHPSERFSEGEKIYCAIKEMDEENGRVTLTHKELLGTWEENARLFKTGQTVTGIVRSKESYGLFIELTPNLTGLAEYMPGIDIGDVVSVFIKGMIPEKKKIKLVVINKLQTAYQKSLQYFIREGRIDVWRYTPQECEKHPIETSF